MRLRVNTPVHSHNPFARRSTVFHSFGLFLFAFFPLDVFAVIVAFPTPFAVIFPPEETAATFLLELVHVTVLLEALDGAIDFFNV